MKRRKPRPDLSERNRKQWASPEFREKMSAVCAGNRWGALRTPDGIARSIEAMRQPEANLKKAVASLGNRHRVGKEPAIKGKRQTDAAREKMRLAWIKRKDQDGIYANPA